MDHLMAGHQAAPMQRVSHQHIAPPTHALLGQSKVLRAKVRKVRNSEHAPSTIRLKANLVRCHPFLTADLAPDALDSVEALGDTFKLQQVGHCLLEQSDTALDHPLSDNQQIRRRITARSQQACGSVQQVLSPIEPTAVLEVDMHVRLVAADPDPEFEQLRRELPRRCFDELCFESIERCKVQGGGPRVSGRVSGSCLLYTSDAADEEDSVDLGGRRIIKKKTRVRIKKKDQSMYEPIKMT
eukprot:TRINITY_DN24737_c0_g1_i2.p2 TRINITY_DN24737_c0_g1~~TRINITY_DN24737_c0_g1_i2.p2  ORF type:complete len:241 (+),score=46.86 TRINITY_DN24737_c0_g1_i2:536-1258(+)